MILERPLEFYTGYEGAMTPPVRARTRARTGPLRALYDCGDRRLDGFTFTEKGAAMTQTQARVRGEGEERLDSGNFEGRLRFQSEGWLVSNLDEHVKDRGTVLLSRFKDSGIVINCYQPGQADEMHAHPKSEHTFLVWKGQLHVSGVEDGEELTLNPGDFVQIKAGYYYQLHNPGTEMAVYCQFRTIPANPAKQGRVWFAQSRRGKQEAAARAGA